MEHNENKLNEIDKMLENFWKEECEIMKRLEVFEKQSKTKLDTFETKLNEIFKLLEEKYLKMASLEASLKFTRESLEKNIIEKEVETSDLDKTEAPNSRLKCSVCEYQAKSSNGLRMHMNKQGLRRTRKLRQCTN